MGKGTGVVMARARILDKANLAYPELSAPQPLYLRKCHDCEKKITDYRCPACRKKHAKQYGVAENGEASWADDFAVGV